MSGATIGDALAVLALMLGALVPLAALMLSEAAAQRARRRRDAERRARRQAAR